ncbi:MAG TPA: amino acid adenylation domain-containing protein, partial [Rhodobacteraceae bacterium]|nr:amino acid adenylation domain-containing protein [Paracoccaceae bacterium]
MIEKSFVELIERLPDHDSPLFTFIRPNQPENETLSAPELRQRAKQVAARLQMVCTAGDRVLLGFQPGLEFIVGFVACAYANVIAVPVPVPTSGKALARMLHIFADAQPACVLSNAQIIAKIKPMPGAGTLFGVPWVDIEEAQLGNASFTPSAPSPDSTLFLQYTSGSVRAPKGVMASHANLLANAQYSTEIYGLSPDDTLVSWLPPHHDFGLIGAIISTLYHGSHCVQMAPATFVMRPYRWLSTMSAFRATITGAPNFAYELCTRRITEAEKETLDLSSLRLALNGAERIRPETQAAFATAFAPCGFNAGAFTPAYGLAEATLHVTSHSRQGANTLPPLLSANLAKIEAGFFKPGKGSQWPALGAVDHKDSRVTVADPKAPKARPDGHIGEICIKGPSIARGYWRQPEETAKVFNQKIGGEAGWLRTGDLGFIWHGQLYLTGREKELIVINGRNIFPHDIEQTIETVDPCFAPSGCAVFALEDQTLSQIGVMIEVQNRRALNTNGLIERLRATLSEQHDIFDVGAVALVKPGAIPRTSSGKIQRLQCAALVASPELKPIWAWQKPVSEVDILGSEEREYIAPTGATEETLTKIWCELLEVEKVSVTDNFFDLSGHSVFAMQVTSKIWAAFEIEIPMQVFFESPTIRGLAAEVDRIQTEGSRNALLDYLQAEAEEDASDTPKTAVELALARIWQETLELDSVCLSDDFLDLGGHSLLATQVISKIREAYQIDIDQSLLLDEDPTLAVLVKHVETALSQTKRTTMQRIPRAKRLAHMPLSYSQKRLWFLYQLEPENPFYIISTPTWLRGSLNLSAMHSALNTLIERHEILRTTFETVEGQPAQIIHDHLSLELPLIDLTHLPPEAAHARALEMAHQEALTPFSLEAGPLIRAKVLKLAEQEHILLFSLHHIASDGWSMGVIVQEFTALYTAACQGIPHSLPDLPIQYVDFSEWQREWLQGGVLLEQLGYWTKHLRGAAPLLALPTDHPRPKMQSFKGATVEINLPAELVNRLYDVGAQSKSTLYMVLMAAFNLLQWRYAGQTDFCTGTYIANRNRADIEPLIGFFVNMLVIRQKINPEMPFSDMLKGVKKTALDAFAHQDLPFEHLVEALRPERTLAHSPLFQTVFVLQNAPMSGLEMPEITTEPLANEILVAKFDLTLRLTEQSDGSLEGGLDYATDLFEASTIEQMAAQLVTLLESICATPGLAIGRLGMVPLPEAAAIENWSGDGTQTGLPFLHAFAEQVGNNPENTALNFGDQSLSYAELNQRANQLAHVLCAAGAGPEHAVGLMFERGFDLIIAMLAILKSGAAYLPLDPGYPAARLAFMLQDTAPKTVLCPADLRGRLPKDTATITLNDPSVLAAPDSNPAVKIGPQNLAYIIYTSGSTGQPKGVGIPHASLGAKISSFIEQVELTPKDRVLQFSSPSFDISVEEIFPTLSTGATLVLADKHSFDAGDEFTSLLADQRVTMVDLPTAYWQQWVGNLTAQNMPESLRTVVVGGEAVSANHLAQWAAVARPDQRWFNTYGPTEATVTASHFEWRAGQALPEFVPIGIPDSHARIAILDQNLSPCPVSTPGDVYISGSGMAPGYLKAPSKTAHAWLPCPFGPSGARMYRTGDVARWKPNGHIEFLGRADSQVKIRGYRVELGEVTAALLAAPNIRDAIASISAAGNLVAHLVGAPELEKLRAHLTRQLPSYMLPMGYVVLDALPLTGSGKVDIGALPRVDVVPDVAGFVAPEGAAEVALAAIWAGVLGLARVGRNDHFFELGGHSLLATQVVSRVRAELEVELELRAVFEHPVLKDLAAALGSTAPVLPRITAQRRSGPLPLSFSQTRLWFLDQLEPGSAFYNITAGLRVSGALDTAALHAALDLILARHEVLRTRFALQNGAPVQLVSEASGFDLRVQDLRGKDPAAALAAAHKYEAETGFDLVTGPLIRGQLLRLSEGEHVLIISMHHIVSDGWSMGVFVREFARFYPDFAAKITPNPAPLPVQFGDVALWQKEVFQGAELARQLGYWQGQLAGMPALLALPLDHPRPAVQSHRGAVYLFDIPADIAESLHVIAHQHDATLFMVLSAAYAVYLSRISGADDVCFGTPIANRQAAQTEDLIGFFVNTLVLRSHVAPTASFTEILAQMRGNALAAYAHQDVPFEHLVEALNPERSLSHTPLFQTMFALQNAPQKPLDLPGLTLHPESPKTTSAKFDLTLSLSPAKEGGLSGSIEYATDLFAADTIARMAAQFT